MYKSIATGYLYSNNFNKGVGKTLKIVRNYIVEIIIERSSKCEILVKCVKQFFFKCR